MITRIRGATPGPSLRPKITLNGCDLEIDQRRGNLAICPIRQGKAATTGTSPPETPELFDLFEFMSLNRALSRSRTVDLLLTI